MPAAFEEMSLEELREVMAREQGEAAFQEQVIAYARARGWLVAHFRPVRQLRRDGSVRHLTPVQADGAGFPDVVMVRGEHVVFAELKRANGRPTAQQRRWLAALEVVGEATGFENLHVFVWRPTDWSSIEEVLG